VTFVEVPFSLVHIARPLRKKRGGREEGREGGRERGREGGRREKVDWEMRKEIFWSTYPNANRIPE